MNKKTIVLTVLALMALAVPAFAQDGALAGLGSTAFAAA